MCFGRSKMGTERLEDSRVVVGLGPEPESELGLVRFIDRGKLVSGVSKPKPGHGGRREPRHGEARTAVEARKNTNLRATTILRSLSALRSRLRAFGERADALNERRLDGHAVPNALDVGPRRLFASGYVSLHVQLGRIAQNSRVIGPLEVG